MFKTATQKSSSNPGSKKARKAAKAKKPAAPKLEVEGKPEFLPVPAPLDKKLSPEQAKSRESVIGMIRRVGAEAESLRADISDIYVDRAKNIRNEASYTEESITLMMDQIRAAHGLLQPIICIPVPPNAENGGRSLELIIGFRRSIAIKKLCEEDPAWGQNIPIIVAKGLANDGAIKLLQMLENVGRQDLTQMEKAITIKQILDDPQANFSQTEVSQMLGLGISQVSKLLSFLNFPEEIQAEINAGNLGFHNADRLRRDIPESHWVATLDIARNYSQIDFDKYCDDAQARYNPEKAAKKAAESDEASPDADGIAADTGDTQRAPTMLRSRDMEKVFLPFLQELKGKVDSTEKKYTEQDIMNARIDTLNTVMLKTDTNLSKLIAPHLEEVKQKEQQEKDNAEATKNEDKWWRTQVKAAETLFKDTNKPDPTNPDKPTIHLTQAYVQVINDAFALSDADRQALGFALPATKEEAGKKLRETHAVMNTERVAAAAAKKKRDEEKAAKDAEEAAAAEAATDAAGTPVVA